MNRWTGHSIIISAQFHYSESTAAEEGGQQRKSSSFSLYNFIFYPGDNEATTNDDELNQHPPSHPHHHPSSGQSTFNSPRNARELFYWTHWFQALFEFEKQKFCTPKIDSLVGGAHSKSNSYRVTGRLAGWLFPFLGCCSNNSQHSKIINCCWLTHTNRSLASIDLTLNHHIISICTTASATAAAAAQHKSLSPRRVRGVSATLQNSYTRATRDV